MNIQKSDWVTCKGFSVVGIVRRVARSGSWADVNWGTHSKRMPTTSLEVQTTIYYGEWKVTDITKQQEVEGCK